MCLAAPTAWTAENGKANNYGYDTFIPNGDEFINSDSSATKSQAVVLLMSYILRHNLTGVAVTD